MVDIVVGRQFVSGWCHLRCWFLVVVGGVVMSSGAVDDHAQHLSLRAAQFVF